jgi:hypothetical protein
LDFTEYFFVEYSSFLQQRRPNALRQLLVAIHLQLL